MTKIFLDTEFTGLHQRTSLISLGLAAENGDLFYGELNDYDIEQINPWLKDNVLPLLSGKLNEAANAKAEATMLVQGDQSAVSYALRNWFARFGHENSVEIWADVLAWDWVLFCELFGGSMELPVQICFIPFDLSTLMKLKGIAPDITREDLGQVKWSHPNLKLAKHHALYDALLEKNVFENITNAK